MNDWRIINAEAPIALGVQTYPNGKASIYPLTTCCRASGKGWESETGVVCRACFRTVDAEYGGFWHADESPMMVGEWNIAGKWADYARLLMEDAGVDAAKADEIVAYARKQLDTCVECGDSISECPVRRQEGMRPGMCGICNDIATEIECEEEQI